VLEKIGRSAYKLELPATWRQIHPVFNEVLLSPYIEPIFKGQKKPPPPPEIEVEGHPEYEVEEILNVQKRGRGLRYLVHWKGYTHEEDTWESRSNITHANEAIEDFYRKNPKALRLRFFNVESSMSSDRETDNGCPFYKCYDNTSEMTINYSDVGQWVAL